MRDERSIGARHEFLYQLDVAAGTLGPLAERRLSDYHGPDWLSKENARRDSENRDRDRDRKDRVRRLEPDQVRDDPRTALYMIGWDSAFEAPFGAARAKARHLKRVADRLHHNKHVTDAELLNVHRKLRELCEIAHRLDA